jgi:hypothetical protein
MGNVWDLMILGEVFHLVCIVEGFWGSIGIRHEATMGLVGRRIGISISYGFMVLFLLSTLGNGSGLDLRQIDTLRVG